MMLNGGRHGSGRILSRPSVETMTTDHLTPAQKAVSGLVPGYFDGHGWGFGVAVVTRREDVAAPVGSYGWDGGLGTSWRSDPSEDMVGRAAISEPRLTRRSTTEFDLNLERSTAMQVQPYLNFDGRCKEALAFYGKALGAKTEMLMRFKDSPDPSMVTPVSEEKVMHSSFRVDDVTVLASDGRCQGQTNFQGISLTLSVADSAEAEKRPC
jgi:CubicO group peptidase (beta-lactamase class C family)